MVCVHTMGNAPYLVVLCQPTLESLIDASSPQSRFFWATLSSELASTMWTASMAPAMSLKFEIVYSGVSRLLLWLYFLRDVSCLTYSEHIIHERSSTRTDLDKFDAVLGAALAHPLRHKPDTDELPEDLRDLRRRDEVSLEPELVPPLLNGSGVVAAQVTGETHAHIAGQRYRPSHLGPRSLASYRMSEQDPS